MPSGARLRLEPAKDIMQLKAAPVYDGDQVRRDLSHDAASFNDPLVTRWLAPNRSNVGGMVGGLCATGRLQIASVGTAVIRFVQAVPNDATVVACGVPSVWNSIAFIEVMKVDPFTLRLAKMSLVDQTTRAPAPSTKLCPVADPVTAAPPVVVQPPMRWPSESSSRSPEFGIVQVTSAGQKPLMAVKKAVSAAGTPAGERPCE